MLTKNKDIYAIHCKISYGRRFLSFFLLTLAGFLLLYSFIVPFTDQHDPETYSPLAGFAVAIIPAFAGMAVGTKRSYYINRTKKRIYAHKKVSRFVFSGAQVSYSKLLYISIFRATTGYYELRLFYDDSKNLRLMEIKNKERALARVNRISEGLSIPVNNLIVERYREEVAPNIPKDQREISVFISEGNRPLLHKILASFFYTIAAFLLYYSFVILSRNNYEFVKGLQSFAFIITLCIMLGISFSIVRDYLFDLKNGQYRIIRRIGPLEIGKWMVLRGVEYLSVHLRRHQTYQISIWIEKGQPIGIGWHDEPDAAMEMAKKIARRFQVDIWDATTTSKEKKWIRIDQINFEEADSMPVFNKLEAPNEEQGD